MIERRIVQLKVQTRKQRDRWTHARTHARSVVSTHDIVERRSNLLSLCRRTNNTIIFISSFQETLNSLARLSIDALARLGGYLSK